MRNETFFPGGHNMPLKSTKKKRLVTIEFFGFVEGWALKRDIDYAMSL